MGSLCGQQRDGSGGPHEGGACPPHHGVPGAEERAWHIAGARATLLNQWSHWVQKVAE